jgi:hypothetical protein
VSVPVALTELPEQVAAVGPEALLTTVGPERTAHVVSVVVAVVDDLLVCGAGRRTAANLADNPACTLVFPTVDHESLRLIVDGTGTVVDDRIEISPRTAIRHRRARK